MKTKFKSKVNKKLLKKYAEKGMLWTDNFGNSVDDLKCDHCGKIRAAHLIGLGNPENFDFIQDADIVYCVGSKCLKDLKKEIGGVWKKWQRRHSS